MTAPTTAISADDPPQLAPAPLLSAYAAGAFPMDGEDGLRFYTVPDNQPRPVIELAGLRLPRSARRALARYELRYDTAFAEVLQHCARPRHDEDGVWLTARLQRAYLRLHELGCARSFEAWHDGQLVGGWFAVMVGRTVSAESMFHHADGAGTAALAGGLVELRERGYELVDLQMSSPLAGRLGAVEIDREDYLTRLRAGLRPNPARRRYGD